MSGAPASDQRATLEDMASMTFGPPEEGPLTLPIDGDQWMQDCHNTWQLMVIATKVCSDDDTAMSRFFGADPAEVLPAPHKEARERMLQAFTEDAGEAIKQLKAVVDLLKSAETRALVIAARIITKQEAA